MSEAEAYLAGLKLLARRELSEAQLRKRLAGRRLDPDDIDAAVRRLQTEHALDDRRVALACARTEVRLRQRGRVRVARQIEGLGIDRAIARSAVAEVFAEIDEGALLEQALERRLRRGASLARAEDARRLHRYLIAQGFEPSRVMALLKSRVRAAGIAELGTGESECRNENPESEFRIGIRNRNQNR